MRDNPNHIYDICRRCGKKYEIGEKSRLCLRCLDNLWGFITTNPNILDRKGKGGLG
jgi:hypothetical protein